MKAKLLACSIALALAALTGCSSSQNAVNRSLGKAEATQAFAVENNIDASVTSNASSKLESAKALKNDGKEEEAEALAEQSELDLRLAIAKSENEVAKNEDKKLEEALRADEERKVLYQSILNKETNK
jgi:osmotically-inducible protein OsmY